MIEIKKATELESFSINDVKSFCNTMTPDAITDNNIGRTYIFLKQQKMAAALCLKYTNTTNTYYVQEVMVHRDFRGTDVTDSVKQYIKNLSNKHNTTAHISTANLRSINFFFSMGFRAVSFHRNFYRKTGYHSGDAIKVALTLPDHPLYNKEYDVDNFYKILGETNATKHNQRTSNRDSSTEGQRIRLV